jgi:hypothetical protein
VYMSSARDRTMSERVARVARAVQERSRRLEILDRRAAARRRAEDGRVRDAAGDITGDRASQNPTISGGNRVRD